MSDADPRNFVVFASIKHTLKKVRWLGALNAIMKAYRMKKAYRATVSHYQRQPHVPRAVQGSTRWEMIALRLQSAGTLLNVFFMGTDEQQDRSGLLQALERIGQVSYYTRADGSYGQNDPAPPDVRKKANTRRLWDLIHQLHAEEKTPHLLIAQTWASVIEPQIFSRIRQSFGTLVVNIAMDDRHQYWGTKVNGAWDGTFPLIPHIDLTLTAAPECVEWYQKEGCPAVFFPEASDPDIFHPMPNLPKVHDVCFVGRCYGIRERVVRALRSAGIRVTAYGSGWENDRIDTRDVPRLFAQSKIILGVGTIGHCKDFYALKMRDFDGPMSGSFYLTHDNPDLHQLYEIGKEIVTYRSFDDCTLKVKQYLLDEEERERIAAAGRARAVKDHTWDKRFGDLFALLRALNQQL